ncbi:MAG: Ig-like domain-containing protein, partial [Treponema sp.]|nr:Ig-like domain-containing protein [Treponema sp.]
MTKKGQLSVFIGFLVLVAATLVLSGCPETGTTDPELTGQVTITGAAKVNSTLSANTSSLGGEGTILYQWERGETQNGTFTEITNATQATYLLLPGDEGKYITVTVRRFGYVGSKTATAILIGPADIDTTPTVTNVTVSPKTDNVIRGQTRQFSAQVTGTNNPATTVTWSVSGTLSSITNTGLLTVSASETAGTTLTITATSTQDTSKSDTATVTVQNPALTGSVVITGNAQVGSTLTADITNLDGTGVASYEWKRGTTTVGINANTYQPVIGDVGSTITVTVTRAGYTGSQTSAATSAVLAQDVPTPTVTGVTVNPVNPTLNTGTTQQFTATVTGTNNPPQSVTWTITETHAAGTSISNSISNNGLLTIDSIEDAETLTIRATSTFNNSVSGTSIVTIIKPVLTGDVSITGTPQAGNILTANTNNLHGTGVITYIWKRGETTIGANTSSYTPVAGDVGSTITVTVTRAGYSGSVTSSAVGPVIAAPDNTQEVTGTVTVNNGIDNVTVSITNTGPLTLSKTGTLTVTIDGAYQGYLWFVDNVPLINESGPSL